jgi:hypothetical protein
MMRKKFWFNTVVLGRITGVTEIEGHKNFEGEAIHG